jgi:hypothetical protein
MPNDTDRKKTDASGNDLAYSKELYKETSKRLDKTYIILITFILVFFFGAFMPYTFLKHKLESTASDDIIKNLSQLSRLALEQDKISKSIQNKIDEVALASINDYKGLDEYFRKLELLESKAIASSSNLSVSELDTVVPSFLVCNEKFHLNMTVWASCNAKFVSDAINKKIIFRFQQLPLQIKSLVTKSQNNWNDFYQVAIPLTSNRTNSVIPLGIEPKEWKAIQERIAIDTGQMNLLKRKAEQVIDLLSRKDQSVLWDLLRTPSSSGIAYSDNFGKRIDATINSLNQTKTQLRQAINDLSSKFEQIDFPVVGKIPIGLANAVIAFPTAIGVGTLICSYYLGQTISKRLVFHRNLKKLYPDDKFDRELYPVWVDPMDRPLFRYSKLVLFVSLPLLVLFLVILLTFSAPANVGYSVTFSFLGFPENMVLATAVLIGLVLTGLGIFIILKKSFEYHSFLKQTKVR